MSDFPGGKVDGSSTLSAAEWNQTVGLNNIITSSGQTASDSDLTQLSKALATYGSTSSFYTDSGTTNAYILTPIDDLEAPAAYINGMMIRFRAGNANTGASTVNVASLGAKDLKKEDGSTDVEAGDIPDDQDVSFRYNGTSFVKTNIPLKATTSSKGASFLNKQITVSNNVTDSDHDLDISAGNFIFSDGSGQAYLSSALTKQIDTTWAAGDDEGGLFSGASLSPNGTYHLFMIYNPSTGVVDAGFDDNLSASNAPSGFIKYKRILSIIVDGSSNIRSFVATPINGGVDLRYGKITETSSVPPTSFTNITITVPVDINVGAHIQQQYRDDNDLSNVINCELKSLYNNVVESGSGTESASEAVNKGMIWTDTSAQIQHKANLGGGALEFYELYSTGYFDPLNQ